MVKKVVPMVKLLKKLNQWFDFKNVGTSGTEVVVVFIFIKVFLFGPQSEAKWRRGSARGP